jgi:hypothetical protein
MKNNNDETDYQNMKYVKRVFVMDIFFRGVSASGFTVYVKLILGRDKLSSLIDRFL